MKKRIRIQGIAIFAAVVVLAVFYRHILAYKRSNILFFTGRIIARGIKADFNPDGKTLITGGIYSLTRNPMYLGTLFIGIGIIIALFNWWVMLILIAVYLSIYLPQISKEKRVLLERFGESFKSYCAATPAFFPSPKKIIFSYTSGCYRLKFRWVARELPSLFLSAALICIVKIGSIILEKNISGAG